MPRPQRSSPKTMRQAGELRRELTPAERKLWARLRGNQLNGVKFRRQHAIGKYIADFCAIQERLIVELDGGQHLELEEYDAERTRVLEEQGYRVIRFWNPQVLNEIENVLIEIMFALGEGEPSPHPASPKFQRTEFGGGESE